MTTFTSRSMLLLGGALSLLISASSAQVVGQSPPNLGANGWLNQGTFGGGGLLPVPGSPPQFLFHQDPAHPFVPNGTGRQPTYRVADLDANPNIKQWAKDVMKKDNDEVIAGKMAKTSRQSCEPAGMPGYDMYGFQPIYFLQEPKKVTMIFTGDQQVRHVYLDVPHSANPSNRPGTENRSAIMKVIRLSSTPSGSTPSASSTITAPRTPKSCTWSSAGGSSRPTAFWK